MIQEKISQAEIAIQLILEDAQRPVVMCSFGKDSMLVLGLVQRFCPKVEVINLRQTNLGQSHKYRFQNKVIEDLKLNIYHDFAPNAVTLSESETAFDLVNHYQAGGQSLMMPCGVKDDGKGVCAKDRILGRPFGVSGWPWDYAFHGHKNDDRDSLYSHVKGLSCDVQQKHQACSFVFPIRHFTDQEVFQALEHIGMDIDLDRYEKVNGQWKEKADKTMNSDYVDVCASCLNPFKDNFVECPKLGGMKVKNISHQIQKTNTSEQDYTG